MLARRAISLTDMICRVTLERGNLSGRDPTPAENSSCLGRTATQVTTETV